MEEGKSEGREKGRGYSKANDLEQRGELTSVICHKAAIALPFVAPQREPSGTAPSFIPKENQNPLVSIVEVTDTLLKEKADEERKENENGENKDEKLEKERPKGEKT
jgi:hypothetical protein